MTESIVLHLYPESFQKIKSGMKDVELRLYDEKRQRLNIGNLITFTDGVAGEQLSRRIVGLCRFKDFRTLVENLGFVRCGYIAKPDNPDIEMEKYYSKEDIKKFGPFAIILATEQSRQRGMIL
ncbi:MAG: hypothetical protein LBB08_02425 [Rickettsiales bacterium]|nr:hypothetical protein [Rickettsiales bacterium]